MEMANLEPRPLYGIGTVARLTGMKPDTLRVWERRYGLGASHKSDTGRRQYTQSDLEHLQLISALVDTGARIGEIASAGRKTLEALLRSQSVNGTAANFDRKPRLLFIGAQLCEWVDEHQGCISSTDTRLARWSLTEAAEQLAAEDGGDIDLMVVECPGLSNAILTVLTDLSERLGASRVLVVYQFGNERWQKELEDRGIAATQFPLDSAYLAYEISQSITHRDTGLGASNLGELIGAKPRQFDETQLSAARGLQGNVDCECPRHISELVQSLASFERYSADCQVENWQDAAVHSRIYAYTAQARWLMEKALSAVVEEHEQDYRTQLQTVRQQQLNGS